jgi:hypothetical protein
LVTDFVGFDVLADGLDDFMFVVFGYAKRYNDSFSFVLRLPARFLFCRFLARHGFLLLEGQVNC